MGLFFVQIFETPQSMLHRLWGYFCPKNIYHYSLLLFRMAARFRASRRDRMTARFRVPLGDQHPSWFIILLTKDVVIHIIKEYIFPEVSNYSLCLYIYSYFLFLGSGANQNNRTSWGWVLLDSPIYLGRVWWWLLILKTGIWIYIPIPRKRILAWGYTTIVLFDMNKYPCFH